MIQKRIFSCNIMNRCASMCASNMINTPYHNVFFIKCTQYNPHTLISLMTIQLSYLLVSGMCVILTRVDAIMYLSDQWLYLIINQCNYSSPDVIPRDESPQIDQENGANYSPCGTRSQVFNNTVWGAVLQYWRRCGNNRTSGPEITYDRAVRHLVGEL